MLWMLFVVIVYSLEPAGGPPYHHAQVSEWAGTEEQCEARLAHIERKPAAQVKAQTGRPPTAVLDARAVSLTLVGGVDDTRQDREQGRRLGDQASICLLGWMEQAAKAHYNHRALVASDLAVLGRSHIGRPSGDENPRTRRVH
jgi:hypothetical protein